MKRTVHWTILFTALVFLLISCSEPGELPPLPDGAEAISLTGDTLFAPELPDEVYREYKANLDDAVADYRRDPEDLDAIIWLGRRLAYLGNYREAVRTFTEGVYKAPEDPRVYRHRGHRYITLRMFDRAIEDFEMAASLMQGLPDQVEPDGLPNELNQPRSTLHTNVWYHLGLAHYLKGNFPEASEAFGRCVEASPNDDMKIAALYWHYMAEKRAGRDESAGRLLELVEPEMDIIENDAYHHLLLVFNGYFDADKILDASGDGLQNATIGYGIGNWHFMNGRYDRAEKIWGEILEAGHWPAFGHIAAEAEMARAQHSRL